uniref:G_PROTEIN_RECEP_F1_2 domain-containing protein n=1 Tax=Angiostrongylus cantonensis TaxID=6313 RepID=A0A0K0D4H3_ANGCA
MHFDYESSMNVVINSDTLEAHYIKAALIPLISIIICAVSYGILIRTVKNNTIHTHRKDIRLSIQVVGLLIALLITCIHFCAQYIFNKNNMTNYVYCMRQFTPLWVGMLTFINPWMVMLLNRPLRRAIIFKHHENTARVFGSRTIQPMKKSMFNETG